MKDSHEREDEVSALLQHMSSIDLMHVEVVAKPTALRRQPLFMLANFSQFGFSTCNLVRGFQYVLLLSDQPAGVVMCAWRLLLPNANMHRVEAACRLVRLTQDIVFQVHREV